MTIKNLRVYKSDNFPHSIIEWDGTYTKYEFCDIKDIKSNYYLMFQIWLLSHMSNDNKYNNTLGKLRVVSLSKYLLPFLNGTVKWL